MAEPYEFTFRVLRASTGEIEEVPTRVLELWTPTGPCQEFDPPLVMNPGDEVGFPPWRLPF